MKDFTTMTPREYSAARRSLPFGAYMLQASGNPDWRKIGRGMIAAMSHIVIITVGCVPYMATMRSTDGL